MVGLATGSRKNERPVVPRTSSIEDIILEPSELQGNGKILDSPRTLPQLVHRVRVYLVNSVNVVVALDAAANWHAHDIK